MDKGLTPEETELLKRLIRPQSGKIPADEFDLGISLWQKLIVPLGPSAADKVVAE